MKKLFCLLFVGLALFSCKKEEDKRVPDDDGKKEEQSGDQSGDQSDKETLKPTYVYDKADLADSTKVTIYQVRSTKRGACYNFIPDTFVYKLAEGISWVYNWGQTPSTTALEDAFREHNVEFVPMFWTNPNNNFTNVANFLDRNPQVTHVLGYNEPNLSDQCNMQPATAAQSWPSVVNFVKGRSGVKLISPAMCHGNIPTYGDPFKWLDAFWAIDGINLSDVSAIACHSYMEAAGATINFGDEFTTKYNKKYWLTEFCAWGDFNGGYEGQQKFMNEMLYKLEKDDNCERYAWFKFDGGITSKPWNGCYFKRALTEIGKLYMYYSTFDQSVVYPSNKWIPAEHFRNANEKIKCYATTDTDGNLEINSFSDEDFVEYKVALEAGENILHFRYQVNRNIKLKISLDGVSLGEFALTETGEKGDAWGTAHIKLDIPSAGDKVVKFTTNGGILNINRFAFEN